MGSQVVTFAASICPQIKTNSLKMVVKSGGNWKRPVNRMYAYNFQIGENYYSSTEWNKCECVCGSISRNNQEIKTSYFNYVDRKTIFHPLPLLNRIALELPP